MQPFDFNEMFQYVMCIRSMNAFYLLLHEDENEFHCLVNYVVFLLFSLSVDSLVYCHFAVCSSFTLIGPQVLSIDNIMC